MKIPGRFLRSALPVLVAGLTAGLVTARLSSSPRGDIAPQAIPATQALPPDSGAAGLKEMLRRLGTTGRLMQTVAHPDDEDGGLLTLESRGQGNTVLLLTLNRGEGGQNKVGSNLFDVLGVLRTLELTAADRYYGVEQRFTRVADFGFSKTADETFQKWHGHDIALGDMVRVVRTFRPDVLVARFSGTDRDGHGHHQASSILAREAFRAAADASRFPEQIKEGLEPWQAKKLYIGNVCGFGARTCPDADYTVKLNTGMADPLLGMSYAQFAMEGLRHQLSQGAGGWSVEPGDRFAFYKLVDSVLPTTEKNGHEQDLFDGIDASLPGLATRLGAEESKVPWLRPGLVGMKDDVAAATAEAEKNSGDAAGPLLAGLQASGELIERAQKSNLTEAGKGDLLLQLRTKRDQFEKAVALAAGVKLRVLADERVGGGETPFMAVPGQSFEVKAELSSRVRVSGQKIELELPPGWTYKMLSTAASPLGGSVARFQVSVPLAAEYTRPYWHRNDPETEAINTIDDPRDLTLPFPPAPVQGRAVYTLDGKTATVTAVGFMKAKDANGAEAERAIAVGPAFSVMLEPVQQVVRRGADPGCKVRVAVSSNLTQDTRGTLRLELPSGWPVQPVSLPLEFRTRGEKEESEFTVYPASQREERTEIRAVFEAGGKRYSEGYSIVTREDLDTFYYYQPATQHVSIVDVKVPAGLKVGYIMGAGDDIPTVLQQIGMDVTLVPAEKLGTENLSQYGTIVLGIRANDTQKEIAENHQKLLDYVSAGGTLIMQYNTGVGDFNQDNLTPFHARLSRVRVSVEESPVEILAPGDNVFHYPNQISEHDFDGWVQERGLYFMDQWDAEFKPLLASHDPGEPEQKGGLLRGQFGKGTYIYTGYAFFRQLPAGVPGALRLYVNLLSAGHEKGGGQQSVATGQ